MPSMWHTGLEDVLTPSMHSHGWSTQEALLAALLQMWGFSKLLHLTWADHLKFHSFKAFSHKYLGRTLKLGSPCMAKLTAFCPVHFPLQGSPGHTIISEQDWKRIETSTELHMDFSPEVTWSSREVPFFGCCFLKASYFCFSRLYSATAPSGAASSSAEQEHRLSVEHKGLGVLYTLSSPNSELLLGLGVSPLIKTNKTKQNYNLTRSIKIYYFSQLQSDWH